VKSSITNGAHALVARAGVLLIAAGGFRVSYDAWTTISKASGIRAGLAGYLPWITEGFLALTVYTAWVVRKRGTSGAYPISLAFTLLAIGVYVQVRHGAAHGHTPQLGQVEAGFISALPTLITAASIHLLVLTFEKAKTSEPVEAAPATPVIPDTVEEIQEEWAKEAPQEEPMPEPVIEEPEVASPSAGPFPGAETSYGPAPVALRGAGDFDATAKFEAMAKRATTDRAREYWMMQARNHAL
jgi:hypothetical protein